MKWAQRADKIFVTVQLPDAKNAKVNLEPEGVFTFSASAGAENHVYELKLELFDKVNVEVRYCTFYSFVLMFLWHEWLQDGSWSYTVHLAQND